MPFEFPMKVLKTFGMWVTKESNWKKFFFCLFIHLTFIEGSVLLQLLYLKDVKDFVDFATLMITLPSCAGVEIESCIFQFNIDKVQLMMKMIRECLHEFCISDSYKVELLKIDKIYKFLLWNVFLLVITFPLFSAVKHELIVRVWTPFDLTNDFNYWIIFIYETLTVFVLANLGLCYDIFPSLLMCYVVILLQQLCERFQNIQRKSHKNNRLELIKCMKFQLKIHEIVKILNSTFSTTFLSRGIFSVVIFCTNVFALVLLSDLIILGRLFAFLLHMLSVSFVSCYYGSIITECSNKISDSIIASDWMYESKDYRQLVKIAMECSKKPIKLTAAGVFYVNLESYLSICNSAYSLFCLCRNFVVK